MNVVVVVVVLILAGVLGDLHASLGKGGSRTTSRLERRGSDSDMMRPVSRPFTDAEVRRIVHSSQHVMLVMLCSLCYVILCVKASCVI